MNRDAHSDIDMILREDGAEWRARLGDGGEIDLSRFDARRPGRWTLGMSLSVVGSVGAVTVAVAVAVVFVGTQLPRFAGPATSSSSPGASVAAPATALQATSTPDSTAPAASPTSRPTTQLDVVSEGDLVSASGNLLEREGMVTLCSAVVFQAIEGGAVLCSASNIIGVQGVDVSSLPGEQRGTTWMSSYIRVEGVWSRGTIQVQATQLIERPILPPSELPCPAPTDGWPGNDGSEDQDLRKVLLQDEIAAHPDDYSGIWTAPIDETEQSAVVVGTVRDVEETARELRAIYPYNLCVFAARYSLAELHATERELRRATGLPWSVSVDPFRNRVRVETLVLDQRVADALAPYIGQVVVETVVLRSP